jgi:hypothetical protein
MAQTKSSAKTESKTAVRKDEKTVKIRVLVRIRADFGAFDKDLVYEVSSEIADRLVKSGRAEKVK